MELKRQHQLSQFRFNELRRRRCQQKFKQPYRYSSCVLEFYIIEIKISIIVSFTPIEMTMLITTLEAEQEEHCDSVNKHAFACQYPVHLNWFSTKHANRTKTNTYPPRSQYQFIIAWINSSSLGRLLSHQHTKSNIKGTWPEHQEHKNNKISFRFGEEFFMERNGTPALKPIFQKPVFAPGGTLGRAAAATGIASAQR